MPRDIALRNDAPRISRDPGHSRVPALRLNHRRWAVPHAWGNPTHYWGYVKQIEAGHHIPSVDDLLLGMPPYRHDLLSDLKRACDDARKLLDSAVIPEQSDAQGPAAQFDLHRMASHAASDLRPALSVYERDQAALLIEQIGAAARSVAEGKFLSAEDFSALEDALRARSLALADILSPTVLRLRLLALRIHGSSDFEHAGHVDQEDLNRLYTETEALVLDMLGKAAEHKRTLGQPFSSTPYREGLSWLAYGVLYPIGPDAQAMQRSPDGFAQDITPQRTALPTSSDPRGGARPAADRNPQSHPTGPRS